MLEQVVGDLLAECQELDSVVSELPRSDWERRTPFFDWTIRDQILHLHQVDMFGVVAMRSHDEFAETVRRVREHQAVGIELSEQARRDHAEQSAQEVLGLWHQGYLQVIAQLQGADPKSRMAWFGPGMSLISFASARQMEVWAHGQDIYDTLDLTRTPQDRIRNICDIGVRTHGWSFRNRKLDVPPAPRVCLKAPSGAEWDWPGTSDEIVSGPALDFALVVTQRRAAEDTRLLTTGDNAAQWLRIAQCFAGAPQARAEPGTRPPLSPP